VKKYILLFGLVFIGLQFVHLAVPQLRAENPTVVNNIVWDSPETEATWNAACADCHSNTTDWPVYSKVAPVSWFIVNHVNEGRDKLNISTDLLIDVNELIKETRNHKMPLPSYTYFGLHPNAKLSDSEIEKLIQGFEATFTTPRISPSNIATSSSVEDTNNTSETSSQAMVENTSENVILSVEEVAKHTGIDSCWSIINNKVYDLTIYITQHKGGEAKILSICGKDGTNDFSGEHANQQKPATFLNEFLLGDLETEVVYQGPIESDIVSSQTKQNKGDLDDDGDHYDDQYDNDDGDHDDDDNDHNDDDHDDDDHEDDD